MKIVTFFILCVFLLNLAGCAATSTFEGSSVKNADFYSLEIKAMNGTDTHTLELKAGDTLKIQFAVEKGSLDMKITVPDGTALYQGDGTVKKFSVEAPMDGIYPIVVVGQKATGSIHIDVERAPEAVEPVGTQEPELLTLTAGYPGKDVVELVNPRGDQTTAYKLADGTYMDRIERRFIYNGTDTWTDENGIDWNEAIK